MNLVNNKPKKSIRLTLWAFILYCTLLRDIFLQILQFTFKLLYQQCFILKMLSISPKGSKTDFAGRLMDSLFRCASWQQDFLLKEKKLFKYKTNIFPTKLDDSVNFHGNWKN